MSTNADTSRSRAAALRRVRAAKTRLSPAEPLHPMELHHRSMSAIRIIAYNRT